MANKGYLVGVLEMPGAQNRPKTWKAEVLEGEGIRISYGRKGSRLRTQWVPISKCMDRDPDAEARGRLRAKITEGYTDVTPTSSPREDQPAADPEPAQPAPKPAGSAVSGLSGGGSWFW